MPGIIHGNKVSAYEEVYATPAPDFQLSKLSLAAGGPASITATSAEIFFVSEGEAEVVQDGVSVSLLKGEAAVAFAGALLNLSPKTKAVIFRASVPASALPA